MAFSLSGLGQRRVHIWAGLPRFAPGKTSTQLLGGGPEELRLFTLVRLMRNQPRLPDRPELERRRPAGTAPFLPGLGRSGRCAMFDRCGRPRWLTSAWTAPSHRWDPARRYGL